MICGLLMVVVCSAAVVGWWLLGCMWWCGGFCFWVGWLGFGWWWWWLVSSIFGDWVVVVVLELRCWVFARWLSFDDLARCLLER